MCFPSVHIVILLGEGLKMGERSRFTTGVTNTDAPEQWKRVGAWPAVG